MDISVSAVRDSRQVEIYADPAALTQLAATVGRIQEAVIELAARDPQPYPISLERLHVCPTEGAVAVSVDGADLVIAGGAQQLAALARNIEFLASGPVGEHIHVEWYSGHAYVLEDSTPLIISVSDA